MGSNEEIAAVIAFLCSERASNVTGVAWSVDGGAVPVITECRRCAMSHEALGKTYPATVYAVGREKIREYAYAVGESNPLHIDHEERGCRVRRPFAGTHSERRAPMNPTDRLVERLYVVALRLYPAPFREAYAPPMRQALRDALTDRSISRRSTLILVVRDLITSLIKEHLVMLRTTYGRPALLFNAVILAGIATGVALALYAIPQQVLRTGADDPQIQLATDAAALLEAAPLHRKPSPPATG